MQPSLYRAFGVAGDAAGGIGDKVFNAFGETEQAEAMRELRQVHPMSSVMTVPKELVVWGASMCARLHRLCQISTRRSSCNMSEEMSFRV